MLPTAPTIYTIEQVLADPIALNSRLGTYTNFVNLLDLCGLAVPAAMRPDGTPFGVTLLAPGGTAMPRWRRSAARFMPRPNCRSARSSIRSRRCAELRRRSRSGEIPLAVVGAHLSGMPLNGELRALGARLIERAATAPHYRLYALPGTKPPKPGLAASEKGDGRRDRDRNLGAF